MSSVPPEDPGHPTQRMPEDQGRPTQPMSEVPQGYQPPPEYNTQQMPPPGYYQMPPPPRNNTAVVLWIVGGIVAVCALVALGMIMSLVVMGQQVNSIFSNISSAL